MRNIIKMQYPAKNRVEKWLDALPSGNGKIGIGILGGITRETVIINHEELWWRGKTEPLPDVSDMLAVTREKILQGKFSEADDVLPNALKERGYGGGSHQNSLPLGDLNIKMSVKSGFSDYDRMLNMENGEITVRWKEEDTAFERVTFVSRAKDVIVYEIRKNGELSIDAEISLGLRDKIDLILPADFEFPKELDIKVENDRIFYSAKTDDTLQDFGAVAKVIAKQGELTCDKSGIFAKGSEKVTVFIKVFVNENKENAWERLARELTEIENDYESLLAEHSLLHKELFDRVEFHLDGGKHELSNEELLLAAYKGCTDAALIEKMWSYGRYLLISSVYQEGLPCTLTGLWNGRFEGYWDFNMANENIQIIYWQALSGNMPELMESVFNYYENSLDDYRTNAQNLYGCRGIYIPADTTPESGILKDTQSHIMHWTGAAGWISQMYYDYYQYTNDVDFLKERAMPFMFEAALFYEDFFIEDENGLYRSYPANSPENISLSLMGTKGICINPTMDFAIAKELITHLIKGAKLTGSYKEKVDTWEEMLSKIPPYRINEDGAICEWMYQGITDNYQQRHLSHIYPVFPGTEITKENNPVLFEAFVTAVKKRLELGLSHQTSWSLTHMANVYGRMGEGNLALRTLELVSRSCIMSNFLTVHNDWRTSGTTMNYTEAPFQIDGNMGWTSAVLEMLAHSIDDIIRILPALPDKWPKGSVKNILCRTGVQVSIDWDMNKGDIKLELLSKSERILHIKTPRNIIRTSCNSELEIGGDIIDVKVLANKAKFIEIKI